MAEVNPGGSPTIMLDGHIDEIGVIVQYIDDDGYVYIAPIGGWDPQVLVGQRIRFLGTRRRRDRRRRQEADPPDEGRRPRARLEVHRSLGGHRRREPRRGRRRGSASAIPGVIDSQDDRLPERPHRLALDRRPHRRVRRARGAAALRSRIRARRASSRPRRRRRRSRGTAAARSSARNCINPQMAIVVDVTFATDHPNIEKKEIGEHKIGGGPVLSRGALISPVVFELLARHRGASTRSSTRCTRRGATRPPTPTRSTSRAKASPPRSCRSRTATCTRRTRS